PLLYLVAPTNDGRAGQQVAEHVVDVGRIEVGEDFVVEDHLDWRETIAAVLDWPSDTGQPDFVARPVPPSADLQCGRSLVLEVLCAGPTCGYHGFESRADLVLERRDARVREGDNSLQDEALP